MVDKGHCKMLHDGVAVFEYADYYDYRYVLRFKVIETQQKLKSFQGKYNCWNLEYFAIAFFCRKSYPDYKEGEAKKPEPMEEGEEGEKKEEEEEEVDEEVLLEQGYQLVLPSGV